MLVEFTAIPGLDEWDYWFERSFKDHAARLEGHLVVLADMWRDPFADCFIPDLLVSLKVFALMNKSGF